MQHSPNLLPVCITSYDAIDDRRLPCLGMGVILSYGIDFDVFRIVHVNELLVYIGTVGARMIQIRIKLA